MEPTIHDEYLVRKWLLPGISEWNEVCADFVDKQIKLGWDYADSYLITNGIVLKFIQIEE